MMLYMSTHRNIKCVEEVRSFHYSVQFILIKIRVKWYEELILLSVFPLKYLEENMQVVAHMILSSSKH